jgi:hypothetical protein
MKFMETAANVSGERGMVRVRRTAYGSDGMTIIETGESAALTPHAAKVTALRMLQAVAEIEEAEGKPEPEAENVARLRA